MKIECNVGQDGAGQGIIGQISKKEPPTRSSPAGIPAIVMGLQFVLPAPSFNWALNTEPGLPVAYYYYCNLMQVIPSGEALSEPEHCSVGASR